MSRRISWPLARPRPLRQEEFHGRSLALALFNLTNAKVSDIDYFYTSRLRDEPREGVTDVHAHPLEPFTVRASFTASF